MRLALLFTPLLLIPAAATQAGVPVSSVKTKVVHATWDLGMPHGRRLRYEWYDPSTGATRREDHGGFHCTRTTVVSSGRMATFGCSPRQVVSLRGPRDPRLIWRTSDLLRPRRLLRLGRASKVGRVSVGSRRAIRILLPINTRYGPGPRDAKHYADVDPVNLIPLRFVYKRPGVVAEYVLRLSRISRRSLPRNFFSTAQR